MRRWVNPSQPDLLQIATFLGYFRGGFILLLGLDFQFVVFPLSDVEVSGRGELSVTNWLLRLGLPVLLIGGAYLMTQGRKIGWTMLLVGAALPVLGRLLLAFGIYLNDSIANDVFGAESPFDYDVIGLIFEVALVALLLHPRSREYEKIWLE